MAKKPKKQKKVTTEEQYVLSSAADSVTDDDASTLAHEYLMAALTKYAAETKRPHDCVPKIIGMAMTEACKEILRLRAIKGAV